MAAVRLSFHDLDTGALPNACMRCGGPATVRPVKTFSWMPVWARWLPPIRAVLFVKERRVPVPLFDAHKRHWTIRYLIGFAGLALVAVPVVCALLLFAAGMDDSQGPYTVLGERVLAWGGGLTLIAWLALVMALRFTAIRAAEITEDAIVLKDVSPEFVRAYREQAHGGQRGRRAPRM